MATKREQILDAAVAALAGTSGVSTRIYRSRVAALSRAEHPALVVEPVSDNADAQTIQRTIWTMLFQVTVYSRASEPDSAADDTVKDVHSKIMNDATLQTLVDISPAGVQWGFHDADKPLAVIAMQFQAVYQTNTLDITS